MGTVQVVELRPVQGDGSGRNWQMELSDAGVRLFDGWGRCALRMPRDEANRRIHFPSFLLSVKHLQVWTDAGRSHFDFVPDNPTLARVREYLDEALRHDPAARRKLRQGATALLLLGLFCLAGGTTVIVLDARRGALLHPDYARRSSPFGMVLFGLVFTLSAIGLFRRAARLGAESPRRPPAASPPPLPKRDGAAPASSATAARPVPPPLPGRRGGT